MKVCVVYHSGYGHTEVIAKNIAEGVKNGGAEAQLIKISQEGKIQDSEWQSLDSCHGIIFGSPTYMGSCSGPFKVFADATSKQWMERKWVNKLAGGFTNSLSFSGDKLSTLTYLTILAAQHGMNWVSNDVLPQGNRTPEDINRIGSYLGVMAQSDNAPSDVTPPKGDQEFAKKYGSRFAEAVKRWNK